MTNTQQKIEAENVLLHRWDYESPEGVKIDKEDITLPDHTAIYSDFKEEEEPIGVAHTLEKTDEGVEADVQLTATEGLAKRATLAPAMTGEVVENEEGHVFKINDVRLEGLGLILNEHEDPRLNKNLKNSMQEEENDSTES